MKLIPPDFETSQHHLHTLVELARAGTSGLGQPQRAVLAALKEIPFQTDSVQTDSDLYSAERKSPSSLKAHTRTSEEAQQLVRLMLVVSLADGPPSAEQITMIQNRWHLQ